MEEEPSLDSAFGSRVLEIHYKTWNINMQVIDPSTSQQLYTLSGDGLGNRLVTTDEKGQVIGCGHTSHSSSSVTIEINGADGTTSTFETRTGKLFGGSPSFNSPAFGGQKMTWKSKAMTRKISYTLIDEKGLPVAKFESAGMAWKKVGSLEIINSVTGEEKLNEIVVTVLTLLYRKLVAMNMAAVV